MSAARYNVLAIGARLHMSAAAVEALSTREIRAWVAFFNAEHEAANGGGGDGAVPLEQLSDAQRRAMFHHGHG